MKIDDISLDDPRVLFVEAKIAGWAGNVPVEELRRALEANSIPEKLWPSPPSENTCLGRAMESVVRGRHNLIRALPKSAGFSLTVETAENLDLETATTDQAYQVSLTAKVERREGQSSVLRFTPEDHPAVPLIRSEYEYFQNVFHAPSDLSQWFSRTVIPWCGGVATRSRGGSYYILKGKYLDRLRSVVAVLSSVSKYEVKSILVGSSTVNITSVSYGGYVVMKPEIPSTAAVEILLDNLIAECDKTCDGIALDLAEKDLSQRGLNSKRRQATDLTSRLKEYEQFLGTNLKDVHTRLAEIEASIVASEARLLGESMKVEMSDRVKSLAGVPSESESSHAA